jgi:hypothetical protein
LATVVWWTSVGPSASASITPLASIRVSGAITMKKLANRALEEKNCCPSSLRGTVPPLAGGTVLG